MTPQGVFFLAVTGNVECNETLCQQLHRGRNIYCISITPLSVLNLRPSASHSRFQARAIIFIQALHDPFPIVRYQLLDPVLDFLDSLLLFSG